MWVMKIRILTTRKCKSMLEVEKKQVHCNEKEQAQDAGHEGKEHAHQLSCSWRSETSLVCPMTKLMNSMDKLTLNKR